MKRYFITVILLFSGTVLAENTAKSVPLNTQDLIKVLGFQIKKYQLYLGKAELGYSFKYTVYLYNDGKFVKKLSSGSLGLGDGRGAMVIKGSLNNRELYIGTENRAGKLINSIIAKRNFNNIVDSGAESAWILADQLVFTIGKEFVTAIKSIGGYGYYDMPEAMGEKLEYMKTKKGKLIVLKGKIVEVK